MHGAAVPGTMVGIALCAATLLSPVRSVAADAATCTALLTARTCYERYLQAIQHAVALRDLHPYLTAERVQLLERGLANAKAEGGDPLQIERVTLQLLQQGASAPSRIREQRFAREASLLVERPGITVEVRLVIEAGTWRIADERFRPTPTF